MNRFFTRYSAPRLHPQIQDSWPIILIIVWLLGILLWLACIHALSGTLEAESAEIARQFLKLRDWTVNHMNGQEDYDKPPLYYWIIGFSKVVTGVSWELASRLPSLVSLFVILILFRAIPQPKDQPVSVWLVFAILLVNPKVISMAQTARMDLMLSMFAFAAIVSFLRHWVSEEKRLVRYGQWYYLFFIFMALAVMTKGPVGFVITAIPVLLFLLWHRAFAQIRHVFLGPGMLLFLLLASPWFIVTSVVTEGRFFRGFILDENLSRFGNLFSGLSFVTFKARPFWQYIPLFIGGFFPWVVFVPSAFRSAFRAIQQRLPAETLLIIYCLWVFVFFSLSGIKRSDYILPLYPAAAWLIAKYLQWGISALYLRRYYLAISGFQLGLFLLLALAPWWLRSQSFSSLLSQNDARQFDHYLNALDYYYHWLIGLTAVLTMLWLVGWKLWARWQIIRIFIVFQGIMLGVFIVFQQLADRPLKDTRPYIEVIANLVQSRPLFFYHQWDEEYGFYFNRHIPIIKHSVELNRVMKDSPEHTFVLIHPRHYFRLFDDQNQLPFVFYQGMPPEHPMYLIANFVPKRRGLPESGTSFLRALSPKNEHLK